MKTIQVFDPPMCCATGVCGTDINPDLINFAALLSQLAQQGVMVERLNMGQQPMAFAENPLVKSLLEKEGTDCLPLILIDGDIYMKGRYPSGIERPALQRTLLTEK